jgi:hypothetical protein
MGFSVNPIISHGWFKRGVSPPLSELNERGCGQAFHAVAASNEERMVSIENIYAKRLNGLLSALQPFC